MREQPLFLDIFACTNLQTLLSGLVSADTQSTQFLARFGQTQSMSFHCAKLCEDNSVNFPETFCNFSDLTSCWDNRERKFSPKFFRPKFFHGRPRGMSVPKCLFFQDLEGLTEVFGRMSAGISGQKLPLWAAFSFLR